MNILMMNGSPKVGGFSDGALNIVASYLEKQGIEARQVRLADADIQECIGCFACLKTGKCVLTDDMEEITARMLDADGFVVASSVRNGLPTACYKRFYERITYTLGFPLLLEDKYTLAICSVGLMGGKGVNKRLLGMQDVCRTTLSGYIFCSVGGIPPKKQPEDIQDRLEQGAAKLIEDIRTRRLKGSFERISSAVDRMIMSRFMFAKSPEAYAHVIECWKQKGYMK